MFTAIVRPAVSEDGPVLLELIDALALYEKLDPPTDEAKTRLLRDGFGERPQFDVLLAEVDGVAVGYAFLLETYSTFLAMPTLYLEDLFVLPTSRGSGAGKALFKAVIAEADRRGCGRVEFVVLDWNQLARDFYHRFNVKHLEEWCFYRLDREDFRATLD